MSDKNIKNAPQHVQDHYHMDHSVRYREDMIKRFPCPEDYEEMYYGYTGPAIDRTNGYDILVLEWGSFNYEFGIQHDGIEVLANPCLYLIKKQAPKKEDGVHLCYYLNCEGETCSWVLDMNSQERISVQWAKTFTIHKTAKEWTEKINEREWASISEREF